MEFTPGPQPDSNEYRLLSEEAARKHIAEKGLPLDPETATWDDILDHSAAQATLNLARQHGLPDSTTAPELAAYFDALVNGKDFLNHKD